MAGRDLRALPLLERKRTLRSILPPQPSRVLYVDHIAGRGVELFRAACAVDLEGVVAKWAAAPYGTEPPSWIKVKNPAYTQAVLSSKRTHRPHRVVAKPAGTELLALKKHADPHYVCVDQTV